MATAYKWRLQLYKYFCKPVYLGHITQSILHEYQNREQVFESSFYPEISDAAYVFTTVHSRRCGNLRRNL